MHEAHLFINHAIDVVGLSIRNLFSVDEWPHVHFYLFKNLFVKFVALLLCELAHLDEGGFPEGVSSDGRVSRRALVGKVIAQIEKRNISGDLALCASAQGL